MYFDRYSSFRVNSEITPIPGIKIPESNSDLSMVYKKGLTRLDKLSQMYYNNPFCGWLILLANPQYGGLEFMIPNMSVLRIPFPYDNAISRYITEVDNYQKLNGK